MNNVMNIKAIIGQHSDCVVPAFAPVFRADSKRWEISSASWKDDYEGF